MRGWTVERARWFERVCDGESQPTEAFCLTERHRRPSHLTERTGGGMNPRAKRDNLLTQAVGDELVDRSHHIQRR
jgi:hypothetical protein